MNSTELLSNIKNEFNNLAHKNYEYRSFKAGYLLAIFKNKMEKEARGGARINAGAKPKYNEPTKTTAFRIPISKVDEVKKMVRDYLNSLSR